MFYYYNYIKIILCFLYVIIIHKLFMALENDVGLQTDWKWEEPVDGNTTAGMIEEGPREKLMKEGSK